MELPCWLSVLSACADSLSFGYFLDLLDDVGLDLPSQHLDPATLAGEQWTCRVHINETHLHRIASNSFLLMCPIGLFSDTLMDRAGEST